MAKAKIAAKKIGKDATLIAANTTVRGDVEFSDQLFVSGRVEGDVMAGEDTGATLNISEEGAVKGNIRVPFVVVNGVVEGNVYAGTRVELAAKARVTGDVYYRLIEMQLGAVVAGQLVYAEQESGSAQVVHRLALGVEESEH